jgi:hypothetical protein
VLKNNPPKRKLVRRAVQLSQAELHFARRQIHENKSQQEYIKGQNLGGPKAKKRVKLNNGNDYCEESGKAGREEEEEEEEEKEQEMAEEEVGERSEN